jgi:hypothetical protein
MVYIITKNLTSHLLKETKDISFTLELLNLTLQLSQLFHLMTLLLQAFQKYWWGVAIPMAFKLQAMLK